MKRFLLSVLLVAVLLVATACGKKGLVGSWNYEGTNYTYTFNEDGTGEYAGAKFTYTTEGDKLSILYDGNTAPFETTYKIEDNKLIIKDSLDNDVIYVRK